MTDMTNTPATEYETQLGDYYELLKPRVMQLVVFTAVVGMLAAPVAVHPVIGFASILFVAIGRAVCNPPKRCTSAWHCPACPS